MPDSGYYGTELARRHAAGFTAFAHAAGRRLAADRGTTTTGDLVVDYGCGAGDIAGHVLPSGHRYLGVDLSAAFLDIAARRFPSASFRQGSLYDVAAPPGTSAIVAVGEVVNYAVDDRAGPEGLAAWLAMCRDALAPDGLLLFDAAGPGRTPPGRSVTQWPGMTVTTWMDDDEVLVRDIALAGGQREAHRLRLLSPEVVLAALADARFSAQSLVGYTDEVPFPPGWTGYEARP